MKNKGQGCSFIDELNWSLTSVIRRLISLARIKKNYTEPQAVAFSWTITFIKCKNTHIISDYTALVIILATVADRINIYQQFLKGLFHCENVFKNNLLGFDGWWHFIKYICLWLKKAFYISAYDLHDSVMFCIITVKIHVYHQYVTIIKILAQFVKSMNVFGMKYCSIWE